MDADVTGESITRDDQPRTVVGRWLVALATPHENERLSVLTRQLNGGKDGFNVDEPAVVSTSCHLAMLHAQQLRGPEVPLQLIDALLTRTSPERLPSRESATAATFATVADPIVTAVEGLTPGGIFNVQSVLFGAACHALTLDITTIERLVRDGEDLAFDLQYSPPLA